MVQPINPKPVIFDSSWSRTDAEPSVAITPDTPLPTELSSASRVAPLLEPREMRNAYVNGMLDGVGLPHPGGTHHKKKLLTTGLLVLGGWAANQATNGLAVPLLTATGGVLGGKRMLAGHNTLQEARREQDPEKAKQAWTMLGQGTPGVANFAAAVPGATNRWVTAFHNKGAPKPIPTVTAMNMAEPVDKTVGSNGVDQISGATGSLIEDDPLAIFEMDKPLPGELKVSAKPSKVEPKGVEYLKDFDVETARAKLEKIFKNG